MNKKIANYLRDIENPVVFELGVHWAEDTQRIINWCKPPVKYFGFEPDPRNLQKIKELNLPYRVIPYAISNKVGQTELYLSDGIHSTNKNQMTGANSIKAPKEVKQKHGWIKFNDTIMVNTTTLDDFCGKKKINKIDFIWSDIQGLEYEMLQGAKNMLPNIGLMKLEYSDIELYEGQKKLKDILKLLGSNWQVIQKDTIDILVKNKKYEY